VTSCQMNSQCLSQHLPARARELGKTVTQSLAAAYPEISTIRKLHSPFTSRWYWPGVSVG
jgi:hypothetical protein